jgi:hypothetical protein
MRTTKLRLDSLTVESFTLDDAPRTGPGTVRAHDAGEPTPVIQTLPLSNCAPSACATCGIYC